MIGGVRCGDGIGMSYMRRKLNEYRKLQMSRVLPSRTLITDHHSRVPSYSIKS